MSFFQDILTKIFYPSSADVIWVYVECNRCKSIIKIRISKSADLTPIYDDKTDALTGYVLNKEAQDDQCFTLIRIHLRFNRDKKLIFQDAVGGKFVQHKDMEKT